MLFDFETFSRLAESTYQGGPYSLEEVLAVFRYYFQRYEEETGRPHPNICLEQIRRIIQLMPYLSLDDIGGYLADVEPFVYEELIDQHFKTKYRHCDYNINHFFSGRIRELRFFETCY